MRLFKLSPHLRRSGLHLADELTPKQLKAQKGLEADFSALKLKGFRPFYRRGELKYRDQGVNRTCKRGEAIRVSAPIRPPRASPAPPGPLLGALLLAVRVYALHCQGIHAQAPQLVGALPLVRVRPLRPLLLLLLLPMRPLLLLLLLPMRPLLLLPMPWLAMETQRCRPLPRGLVLDLLP